MTTAKRPLRLGVNIDHVATVRNARGGPRPDPVRAARLAAEAGADGITAHLREDRRHIRDDDIARLKAEISKPLNFEMAATREMLQAHFGAASLKPDPKAYLEQDFAALAETMALAAGMKLTSENKKVPSGLES